MADRRGLGEGESMKSRRNAEKTNGFANLKTAIERINPFLLLRSPPAPARRPASPPPRPPRGARGPPPRSTRRSSTSPGIATSAAVASARVSRSIAAWIVASSTPARCGSVAAADPPGSGSSGSRGVSRRTVHAHAAAFFVPLAACRNRVTAREIKWRVLDIVLIVVIHTLGYHQKRATAYSAA
jgi:hypothetical protein